MDVITALSSRAMSMAFSEAFPQFRICNTGSVDAGLGLQPGMVDSLRKETQLADEVKLVPVTRLCVPSEYTMLGFGGVGGSETQVMLGAELKEALGVLVELA